MLVQILNIQKSVSVPYILATLFWRYINLIPDWIYLDARIVCLLHTQSSVDLSGNEEVFISIFSWIGHLSAVNDVIQDGLNSVLEIIEGFTLLGTRLNVVTKLLAEGALSTVVQEVGINWHRFSHV